MHALLTTLFLLQTPPQAAQTTAPDHRPKTQEASAIARMAESANSVIVIDPKARAADYMEAFKLLKQEKSTTKVFFQLADGKKISNVIDIKMMPESTLVMFRYSTPKGIQFQVVEIENIVSIMHQ